MPTIAAAKKFPPVLVTRATPPKQPKAIRAISPRGAVRAGVFGSLSAISSTRASIVNTTRVTGRPKKASLVPAKCNQPRCAAQQTAAGGVSERSPVRQPRRKQRRSNVMTGNVPFLRRQYLTLLRGTVASQCERRSTRTADGTSGPRAFPNLPLSFLIFDL